MDISVNNNSILTQATKAYNYFESCQIPFAAVKLNICLQNTTKKEIDEIVEDNFRNEKDLIFKKDKNYFILMQRTTIEAAERAVNRLKAKMGHITRNCENLKDNSYVHASAYIFGSIRGTKKMHIKYLDLNPNLNSFDRKIHKMPLGYGEYLRWFELPKTESLKIKQMIDVVV
jgi:uncharacterized protein YdaT